MIEKILSGGGDGALSHLIFPLHFYICLCFTFL